MTTREEKKPCLKCGACCAYYRASFYWAECDDTVENGVPNNLTKRMDANRRMMLGTGGPEPRCIALLGTVGVEVRCTIYARRASICRSFIPSWENGAHNPRCDKARIAWHLEPLTPEQWGEGPQNLPRAA
jgi:Fe-S-cluster containining protein